jgi:hypothetical protein
VHGDRFDFAAAFDVFTGGGVRVAWAVEQRRSHAILRVVVTLPP